MDGIYLSNKPMGKAVVKETEAERSITVEFDDGKTREFNGIQRITAAMIGGQLPKNPNGTGIAIALVQHGDSVDQWFLFGEESIDHLLNYLHCTTEGKPPNVTLCTPHSRILSAEVAGFGMG